MKNNKYDCYLLSFMQCLAAISEMRDYYLWRNYAKSKDTITKKGDFKISEQLNLFYKAMFKEDNKVVDLDQLKKILYDQYPQNQQHDSHEIMIYLLSNL